MQSAMSGGHEIDRTIADEVAHQAWKTPTACAAAIVERNRADAQRFDDRSIPAQRDRQRLHAARAGQGERDLEHLACMDRLRRI